MSSQANDGQVKPGEFPFPLTGGPSESPFLTWLRNHSKYMAVRGLLDYFRMAAVLVRGILINSLVVLPALLIIALALSLVFGSLLDNWEAQRAPELMAVRYAASARDRAQEAYRVQENKPQGARNEEEATKAQQVLEEAEKVLEKARKAAEALDKGKVPISFFVTRKVVPTAEFDWARWLQGDGQLTPPLSSAEIGWVQWLQDDLGLSPPFLLTPLALALASVWVLLFPIVTMLTRIAGYNRSLATGSDSSVRLRDRYERSFGGALVLVIAVALFEFLPLAVNFYHQVRVAHFDDSARWDEYLAVAIAVLGALSGAPKLLSVLRGAWKKLAMAFVALFGLLVPLSVIVIVSDFLVYESVPFANWPLLAVLYVLAPGIYSAVILIAILVGVWKRTFSGREYARLFGLLAVMIAAHFALITVVVLAWMAVFALYEVHPEVVPSILLAVDSIRADSLVEYGDLAAYVVLGCALEIWLFCWLTVDINQTSIHGLYRDRLASAYLLGLNARGEVDIEEDIPLGELCFHATGSTAPYHLINVALNLQGSTDLNLRDRQSDFFIFSKKFIGGARTGYCRSATMEEVFPQINLAAAMAISAAAASPNMGRSTSPALVAFMTLINVRLGVWIPNPGLLEESLAGRKAGRGNDADLNGRKPGFTFEEVFLDELVSMEKRWEQLGDKGAGRRLVSRRTPTPGHGLAGIGFSGGGIRSATINLGIAQALHRAGIFEHFDYMSTVSGGGYLGSSISALMRYRTRPVSEIAGTVAVETTGAGEKIVTVTPSGSGGARLAYRYSKDAGISVRDGDFVRPGTRLARSPDSRRRSEIAGTVGVETLEAGQQIVRVSGSRPGETREYRYAKYDALAVKPGDSIEAGALLVKERNSFGTRFLWRVRPKALLLEMTMRLDETHRWVNLSDGGHIENLAAIELLRRRCKLIVIGDGEADPDLHFNGLATLMRTARLDLGVEIDINLDELRLDAGRNSRAHLAIGRIVYPGESECGYLLYLKSSCTGDEDEVIGEYRHRSPGFPHESTADQFFDEGQFEAYRALGQHIGEKAIKALAPKNPPDKLAFSEIAGCFQAFWELEEKKRTGEPATAARA